MLACDWSVQNIVYITATDMWLLGKVLIVDCDTRYEGCNDYYRQQLGNMYLVCIYYLLCVICYDAISLPGNQYLTGKAFGATYTEQEYRFFPIWKPNKWNAFCSTYDSNTKVFKTFVNNELAFQFDNLTVTKKESRENIFLLNAFSFAANDYIYPFDGSVTDLHIWTRTLSSEQVEAWANCDASEVGGDFLDWANVTLRLHGDIETSELPQSEVCLGPSVTRYLAFPEKFNFVESVKFCEKIGGEIAVADSFNTIDNIQNALTPFRESGQCSTLFYTGKISSEEHSNVYLSVDRQVTGSRRERGAAC